MKRLSIFALFLAGICIPLSLRGVEEKKMTVVDYFLRLPADYFEGPPVDWLMFLKQPKCGVVDVANGYMSSTGDGAQPPFEVSLFRYRDGRPLLAVCLGELEGAHSLFLDFFEMRTNGKMRKLPRSIFPVIDAGNDEGNWRFELPRHGRTVLVLSQKSGKILRKVTWAGEKFRDEK